MSFGGDPPSNQYPPNPFASPLSSEEQPVQGGPAGELTVNPWVTILSKPRETIRQVVNFDPRHRVLLLSALLGIVSLAGMNDGTDDSANASLSIVIPVALLLGPVIGVALVYLYSAIVRWSSSVLGGVGTAEEIRAAYAWRVVPTIFAGPLTLLTSAVTSPELTDVARPIAEPIIALNGIASFIVAVWSFVISVNTIADVNRFSGWRAFGALILPFLILVVVVFVVFLFLDFAA